MLRAEGAPLRTGAEATVLDVALVIPTRNRAGQLRDLLPHLERLKTRLSWEIIFVDNGSTDATREVLAGYARSSQTRTSLLREAKVGAAAARNTGWRAACARIVAFVDDDCYPSPDLLDEIHRCFAEARLGFVGGRVLRHDPADALVSIQPRSYRVEVPARSFVPPGFILSANLAVRRDILERLGGFDEKLGTGRLFGAEDDDLVARASALGVAGAYDPGPTVFHHHRRSDPQQVQRMLEGFDIARGAFYAKMLLDRCTVGIYLWPALRRTARNILRCNFAVLRREFRGAWRYIVG